MIGRAPEQSVSGSAGQLRTGNSDMVWRVRFRDQPDGDAWLVLILMLEFQSSVDFLMPLRIRQYVDNHHMEMWKGRQQQTGCSRCSPSCCTRAILLGAPQIGAIDKAWIPANGGATIPKRSALCR